MPLFKYVTLDHKSPHLDRIDILINEEIRYTQLGAFNDPFEMPVFLEKLVEASTIDKWLEEDFPDELLRDEYKKLSNAVKKRMPFNMFVEGVNKHKHLAIHPLTHFLEKRMPEFRETIKKTDQYFGVLSLTETPDNLLMWSHYSGQHTGMVIEFDETDPIFNERRSLADELRHLRQVTYSDMRPIIQTFEEFAYTDFMYTKSTQWAYENEWRIAKTITGAKRVIPASPYDICLFAMPASAVTRIILGARVSEMDVDRIRNVLHTTPHLSHIRLQQATLDERRFAINFSDC